MLFITFEFLEFRNYKYYYYLPEMVRIIIEVMPIETKYKQFKHNKAVRAKQALTRH